MAKYNDLDMKNWKEYNDIMTDTLWHIAKRDGSGVHNGHYHGNFVPQIPNQLFRRFTKKGDWILDPFMGSGTSLIEAQRLYRNSIGIELNELVAKDAREKVLIEKNDLCIWEICTGDSRYFELDIIFNKYQINKIQFVIMHPPYWNILKFSENKEDLSNSETLELFLKNLELIIENTCKHLEKNRYCAIVMGDKYENGQVVPLGFYCMDIFIKKGYILKAVLVKDFEETKGKANQKSIWRYRALANDFYIFKHEYIFVFKKVK